MKKIIFLLFLVFIGPQTYASSCELPSFIKINKNIAYRSLFESKRGIKEMAFVPIQASEGSCWVQAVTVIEAEKNIMWLNLNEMSFITVLNISQETVADLINDTLNNS